MAAAFLLTDKLSIPQALGNPSQGFAFVAPTIRALHGVSQGGGNKNQIKLGCLSTWQPAPGPATRLKGLFTRVNRVNDMNTDLTGEKILIIEGSLLSGLKKRSHAGGGTSESGSQRFQRV